MSIRYIVGNPGSGKSYYGVKVLYDAFIRPKHKSFFSVMPAIIKAYKNNEKHKSLDEILKDNEKKDNDYLVAYTNINEFKFELCEHIKKTAWGSNPSLSASIPIKSSFQATFFSLWFPYA